MNTDFVITILDKQLNLSGLLVGIFLFLIIIIGRYSCIAGEYYFTKRLWVLFCIVGIAFVAGALFCENLIVGTMLSIAGFTYLWGILEIIQQEKRVEKGWYPKNPKHK